VWRPLHHCLHIGNFSHATTIIVTCNSRDKLKIAFQISTHHYNTYTTWLLSSSINTSLPNSTQVICSIRFISFWENISLRLHLFLSINKMQQKPRTYYTKADLPPPNPRKLPLSFQVIRQRSTLSSGICYDGRRIQSQQWRPIRHHPSLCHMSRQRGHWRTTWIYHEGLEGFEATLRQLYNHVKMESGIRRRSSHFHQETEGQTPSDLSSTTMIISANSIVLEDGSTKTKRSLRSNITGTFERNWQILTTTSRESDVSKQSQTSTL